MPSPVISHRRLLFSGCLSVCLSVNTMSDKPLVAIYTLGAVVDEDEVIRY